MKLFNTAYYIAKNERPFSDFNQLCTLQVKNGVTLGETYLNDKNVVVSSLKQFPRLWNMKQEI